MIANRFAFLFSRNKRMIAGNWKSNFTHAEALNFVNNTINNIQFNPNNVGNPSPTQTSSSPPSSSTSPPSSPSTTTNSSSTRSPPRTAPTTIWEPTPDRSAPNISKISDSNGSFWDIPKEEPSSRKMINLLSLRPSWPLRTDSKLSTALGRPSKVCFCLSRKKWQQDLGCSRQPAQTSPCSLPQRQPPLAQQHRPGLRTRLGHRNRHQLHPRADPLSFHLAQAKIDQRHQLIRQSENPLRRQRKRQKRRRLHEDKNPGRPADRRSLNETRIRRYGQNR